MQIKTLIRGGRVKSGRLLRGFVNCRKKTLASSQFLTPTDPSPQSCRKKTIRMYTLFQKSCKHERGQILHLQHHINQIIICSGKKNTRRNA